MGASDEIRDGLVARQIDLLRVAEWEDARTALFFDELYQQMAGQIGPSGITDPSSISHRRKALRDLFQGYRGILGDGFKDYSEFIHGDMTQLAYAEQEWTRALMNRATRMDLARNMMTPEWLKKVVNTHSVHGGPMKSWFAKQSVDAQQRVMNTVRLGMAQGKSVREMSLDLIGKPTGRMRKIVHPTTGSRMLMQMRSGGLSQQTARNAAGIVRTGALGIAADARRDMYFANQDVVKGLAQLSTLDGRTTEVCVAYDGESWEFEQEDQKDRSEAVRAPARANTRRAILDDEWGKAPASLKRWSGLSAKQMEKFRQDSPANYWALANHMRRHKGYQMPSKKQGVVNGKLEEMFGSPPTGTRPISVAPPPAPKPVPKPVPKVAPKPKIDPAPVVTGEVGVISTGPRAYPPNGKWPNSVGPFRGEAVKYLPDDVLDNWQLLNWLKIKKDPKALAALKKYVAAAKAGKEAVLDKAMLERIRKGFGIDDIVATRTTTGAAAQKLAKEAAEEAGETRTAPSIITKGDVEDWKKKTGPGGEKLSGAEKIAMRSELRSLEDTVFDKTEDLMVERARREGLVRGTDAWYAALEEVKVSFSQGKRYKELTDALASGYSAGSGTAGLTGSEFLKEFMFRSGKRFTEHDHIGFKGLNRAEFGAIETAEDWLANLFGLKKAPIGKNLTLNIVESRRGKYFENVIRMPKRGVDAKTFIHEFGHHLEWNVKGWRDAGVDFLHLRTRNSPVSSMAELFPGIGYSKAERVLPDKFFHPYMGRDYGSLNVSEMISMALESMFTDPDDFLLRDPETFWWMIDLIAEMRAKQWGP